MKTINYLNLGARERTKDKRDFPLEKYTGTAIVRPNIFMQDVAFRLPILYQGQYGTCGAHAGAWFKMLQEANQLLIAGESMEKVLKKYSPRFLWTLIKQIDGYGLNDGTDIRSILKSLQSFGICKYDTFPNDLSTTIQDYSNPQKITQAMKMEAAANGISGYGFSTPRSLEALKDAIYANKGVIILMRIGTGLYSPSWAEKDILPLKLGSLIGGHFVVAHSYDEKYVYFTNSFSEDWGRKGHGYFGADYVKYINEIGTAIDLPEDRFIFKDVATFMSTSETVRQLQLRLGVIPTTGYFGWTTLLALVKFQIKNKLLITGKTDAKTNAILNTLFIN